MRRLLPAVIFIGFCLVLVLPAFAQTNQVLTNGGSSTPVNFAGPGCTYNWTNSNPSIGLATSGTGDITSFTATNTTGSPVTSTITATPVAGGYAYIANESDGTVSVIDIANNQVIKTIPIASNAGPWSVSVSPDGKYAYIADTNIGTISVVNTATNTIVKTFTPVSSYSYGLCVSPDGSRLYITDYSTNSVSIINTTTYAVIKTIAVGKNPTAITVSPNGSTIYVVNSVSSTISVINAANSSVSATIVSPALIPIDVTVSPDGKNLYFTAQQNIYIVNTATNNITGQVALNNSTYGIVVSPDSKRIYVANPSSNSVSVVDAVRQAIVATISIGDQPEGVSLNADGSILMVTNYRSSSVSVINTSTNSVITTIPVGAFPLCLGNFISPNPSACTGSVITFTITVNPAAAGPVITATSATGAIISCVGSASASPNLQQFTFTGSDLSAPVIATAPIGFEVSLTPGSGYSNSVTINQSAGVLSITTIYVRSGAGDPDGPISGNVTLSSTGAANQSVLVSGTVNALPTVNTVPNQIATNGASTAAINFTGTSSTFNWVNDTPGIGLAANGTGNIPSFIAVNSGPQPVVAHVTVTPMPNGYAYIANLNDNTVSVINTTTNKVVYTIPVGKQPEGVAISKDGQTVYVTNFGSNNISVISVASNTVTSTINNVGQGPYQVILSPDGSKLYVSNVAVNTVSVISVATGTVVNTFTIGNNPDGIRLNADGSLLYAASALTNEVYVINTATNALIATIPVGTIPEDLVVSTDGGKVFVISAGSTDLSIINTVNYSVIKTIHIGTNLQAICMSADGSKIYISDIGTNQILVYDTATYNLLTTIAVQNQPEGISLSPDGSELYVANQTSNTVSVINTQSNAVASTIAVGNAPFSIGQFISAGSGCSGTPTSFTITVNPLSIPTITSTTANGTITACEGTASSGLNMQQFSVSGSGLNTNITATAPPYFEISLNATSGFGVSLVLPQTGGTVSNTLIYVRSSATAPAGVISGNISLTSAGATSQLIAVTGTINAVPLVNAVLSQTIVNGGASTPVNFSGTATIFNWVNDTPGIGLAASGTGDIPLFNAVNNTNNPIKATITVTPLNNTNCDGVPIIFTITVNPTPVPTSLTASANLIPRATIYGTPSQAESFAVSGTNISGGILVTPPAGLEVSSNGTVFNATAITGNNGNISSAPVYIRLAATTPVGSYSGNIVLSTNNTTSVNVFIPGSTVSPAPLTITADNITKPFGSVNPLLTATYAGFVNNDGPKQLSPQPTVTTSALTQSPIGEYPITVGDAASPNYSFTYVFGTLTIVPSLSLLSIPNTFTPNGDGINDTWEIKYLNYYPKSTVNIFNRYGQKVFSSVGYPTPWDGTYKGTVLPSGTYYYIIDPKNGQAVFSGWLAIIK